MLGFYFPFLPICVGNLGILSLFTYCNEHCPRSNFAEACPTFFGEPFVTNLGLLKVIFPECVARVPVSLWGSGGLGVWGLRVCSLDVAKPSATARNRPQPLATVRNRSQPSTTVRNRSRDCYMAVPNGKFCRSHFWMFPTFRCFVSRGRRGTL